MGVDDADSHTSNVLPVGKFAALGREARMERARPTDSSVNRALMTSVGSQRYSEVLLYCDDLPTPPRVGRHPSARAREYVSAVM